MKNCIRISLIKYTDTPLNVQDFEKFNKVVFDFFHRYDVLPRYWSVVDKYYNGKISKFSFKKLENLKDKRKYLDKDGDIIEGLSYTLNPKNSDAPAFDRFVEFAIAYSKEGKEVYILCIIDPNKIDIEDAQIYELVKNFNTIFEADYGMIYFHKQYERVNAEVSVYKDGNSEYSQEEEKKLDWWYGLTNEERLQNIRYIYPINFLNTKYFKTQIDDLIHNYYLKVVDIKSKNLVCLIKTEYMNYFK